MYRRVTEYGEPGDNESNVVYMSLWCKECSNYRTIALISHAGKVILKIFQDGLQ